jgi:lactoylglutathione lyase
VIAGEAPLGSEPWRDVGNLRLPRRPPASASRRADGGLRGGNPRSSQCSITDPLPGILGSKTPRRASVLVQRLTLTIHVNDLSLSKAFYADLLGLPLTTDERWGAVLEVGDVRLFLHAADATLGARQHLEMTFDVDDADSAIAALKAKGIPVLEEPTDRDEGDRNVVVQDPDGNVVALQSKGRAT